MIWMVFAACFTFTIQTIAMKSVRAQGLRQNLLVTGILSVLVAAGMWAAGVFSGPSFSGFTVGMGCLFGGLYVTTVVCYYYAMQTGPLSYSTFFYSSSMLIPSLAGMLIWHEPFTWQSGAGICLFLGAFFLISVPGKSGGQKISGKWILFCFFSWLGNGCLSLAVKTHQMQMVGREGNELLMAGYLAAAVLALGLFCVLHRKQKTQNCGVLVRSSLLWLIIAAAGNGGGNAMVTYLASRLGSVYLYPTVLGGMLVLVTVYSTAVLKEKLSKAGLAGLLCGLLAIVIMNL